MNQLCIHFGRCGGCTLQDLAESDYRARKRDLVADALARKGLDARVGDIVAVPPRSRRRASLKLAKKSGVVAIGFHARASHDIVDMTQCRVLTPGLTTLVQSLRDGFATLLAEGETCEIDVTETDNGFDLALAWKRAPARIAELARLAERIGIARITHANEILVGLAAPEISLSDVPVKLPPGAFLQPTRQGEAALAARVTALLMGAKHVADLFAGCGTFTLAVARQARVHAVEKDVAQLAALATAVRIAQGLKPVTAEKRDLFRTPLGPAELARFDAVVLDPPRAGAAAQIRTLAASKIRRIVYVSCNPASFARDARRLVEAGFVPGPVIPIDQFLWSGHIELVVGFERGRPAR